jgi:hypothetical protein
MNNPNNHTEETLLSEEGFPLNLRPRPSTSVSIQIPTNTVSSLEKIAGSRDMSLEALIKLYIGQGLRQDLAKQFADHVLEKTAQVLTKHIQSQEEISAILKEIRNESAA